MTISTGLSAALFIAWAAMSSSQAVVLPAASAEDRLLIKVVEAYQWKPRDTRDLKLDDKFRLGQALFFDPLVSGPKAIACAACHVRSRGAGDGLPVAIGLGARGVSTERKSRLDAFVVPRNALPFFDRGRNEFRALFWDGRVQIGPDGRLETPLGRNLPAGFDNLLAAAAIFPPVEPDEMLGRPEAKDRNKLQYHHELLDGTLAASEDFQRRSLTVFGSLLERLVARSGKAEPNAVQLRYRELFGAAYPGVPLEKLNISHFGNALSAYIGAAFELEKTPWDHYVEGRREALSPSQKRGALLFFGKARCSACHSGPQFSDFQFHGLAVPQLSPGKHGAFLDYGRAGATSRAEDRFKFRTPPLRNVAQTGPWGHNGAFDTLRAVVVHHFNPVPALFAVQSAYPEAGQLAGRLLAARSPLLGEMSPLTEKDLDDLLGFLNALSSKPVIADGVALPKSVPSGDMQFVRP